jgi:uncharacterized protein (DUF885 family)
MKKQNKSRQPKKTIVKDLAEQFASDFTKQLPVTVLPDGGIVYKEFLIKQQTTGNWGVYNIRSKSLVEQYFLKTCALMGAKAYNSTNIDKFFEIKRLDNRYWASYCDLLVYKKNIKTAKDFDRYVILLNKLEDTETKTEHFKEQISRMFKWSFV